MIRVRGRFRRYFARQGFQSITPARAEVPGGKIATHWLTALAVSRCCKGAQAGCLCHQKVPRSLIIARLCACLAARQGSTAQPVIRLAGGAMRTLRYAILMAALLLISSVYSISTSETTPFLLTVVDRNGLAVPDVQVSTDN